MSSSHGLAVECRLVTVPADNFVKNYYENDQVSVPAVLVFKSTLCYCLMLHSLELNITIITLV